MKTILGLTTFMYLVFLIVFTIFYENNFALLSVTCMAIIVIYFEYQKYELETDKRLLTSEVIVRRLKEVSHNNLEVLDKQRRRLDVFPKYIKNYNENEHAFIQDLEEQVKFLEETIKDGMNIVEKSNNLLKDISYKLEDMKIYEK